MPPVRMLSIALALLLCPPPAAAGEQAPASLASLVASADIAHDSFTLPNGLRVVVATDRSSPVVAVSVWYGVGSKHEPAGRSGFAHLFEHLLFYGSENAPGNFWSLMRDLGASDVNGTTYYDRTNYYQTVPTAALDRTLFLESDRMGHFAGAIDQRKLDAQRGVVQNEKRQNDIEPFGMVPYRVPAALFPPGHPYAHYPIGSMTDLDRASLADVRGWFRDHYGPDNAVIALAGDIDTATAKALMTRYFGHIPRGPARPVRALTVPTLARPVAERITDRVGNTRIVRAWAIPGVTARDAADLEVAAAILGNGPSSRLASDLVTRGAIATDARMSYNVLAEGGILSITANLRDGIDPTAAAARLDGLLADFLRRGPGEDEVRRAATRLVVRQMKAIGRPAGIAATLAEATLFAGSTDLYRHRLRGIAAATPASVRAAARRWIGRPAYTLTIAPGPRDAYAESAAVDRPAAPGPVPPAAEAVTAEAVAAKRVAAPIGQPAARSGAAVVHGRLANGMPFSYARMASPITYLAINFDAGRAADDAAGHGLADLTVAAMAQSPAGLDAIGFARARDRIGLETGIANSEDETRAFMNVPGVNLDRGLALLAAMVREPAFAPADIARVRDQQLAFIASERTIPFTIAGQVGAPLVYGAGSAYAGSRGSGDPAVVRAATRADLVAFRQAWLRPDTASVFVVSDRPLAEVRAALDRSFGDWRQGGATGRKAPAVTTPSGAQIVLVDLPGTPQSYISAERVTPLTGRDDLSALWAANAVIGQRLNTVLREEKHWTYGAGSRLHVSVKAVTWSASSSVQTDRTGAAIVEMRRIIADAVARGPAVQPPRDAAPTAPPPRLNGEFVDSPAKLSRMMADARTGRSGDRQAAAAAPPAAAMPFAAAVDPDRLVWVVVGEAARVRPQLDGLGLPVSIVSVGD